MMIGKIRSMVFTAAAFAALGILMISSRPRNPDLIKGRVPARLKIVPLGEGEPWYGGKPSLPVQVESDVEGAIPGGEWIPVRLTITADLECQSVSTRVRGVDALEVISSEDSQACRSGSSVTLETRVRILEGGSGMMAVDITVQTSQGPQVVTRAIPFRASS